MQKMTTPSKNQSKVIIVDKKDGVCRVLLNRPQILNAFNEELIEFCRNKISNIKCPKKIDFLEEFPRTPEGKLLKRVLIEKYK
jgi:acyl-CoA synthetase (AMP-forming)/AMP-acid ligase II